MHYCSHLTQKVLLWEQKGQFCSNTMCDRSAEKGGKYSNVYFEHSLQLLYIGIVLLV